MVSRQFKSTLKAPKVDDYFDKLGLVGEGTYGQVFKTTKKGGDPSVFYALKCMIVMFHGQPDGLSISTCREIALLRELKHENVIEVQRVFLNHLTHEVSLLSDFSEYDLQAMIVHHHNQRKRDPEFAPNEGMLKSIMHQLLKGIFYLHSNWILHRDLKPANVLVMGIDPGTKDPGRVKIADLGMARLFNAPLKPLADVDPVVVTFWYRAPELLLGARHYTKAVDLWAIGCIMAELATSRPLFCTKADETVKDPYQKEQLRLIFNTLGYPNSIGKDHNPSDLDWQYLSHLPGYARAKADFPKLDAGRKRVSSSNGLRDELEKHAVRMSHQKFQLLERLLRMDPKHRISAKAALQHQYFQSAPLPKLNIFADLRETDFTYPPRPFVKPKERPSADNRRRKRSNAETAGAEDKRLKP